MPRPPLIAPSILAADYTRLGAECADACAAGADWIHLDVMDGRFVPPISFGLDVCAALRPHITGIMDVHLMVTPADSQIAAAVSAGADFVTAHVEASIHLDRTLSEIRRLGARAGVALNPATSPTTLEHVLDRVDLICVMTVNPGFGGQSFLHAQLEKIRQIRGMIGDREIRLQVDGGVNPDTAALAAAAGADVFVAGSSVFRAEEPQQMRDLTDRIAAIRSAATLDRAD